jgi:hypothetical protein
MDEETSSLAQMPQRQKYLISAIFYLSSLPYHCIFIDSIILYNFQNFTFITIIVDLYRIWLILCNVAFQYNLLVLMFACLSLTYAFRNYRSQYGDIRTGTTCDRLRSYIVVQQKLIALLDAFNVHFSNYLSAVIVLHMVFLTLSTYFIPITIDSHVLVGRYYVCTGLYSLCCLLVVLTPLAMLYDEVSSALSCFSTEYEDHTFSLQVHQTMSFACPNVMLWQSNEVNIFYFILEAKM